MSVEGDAAGVRHSPLDTARLPAIFDNDAVWGSQGCSEWMRHRYQLDCGRLTSIVDRSVAQKLGGVIRVFDSYRISGCNTFHQISLTYNHR